MRFLVCPACKGEMKEVNKRGVLIDTCTECRGVWLDRGELEKIAGALEAGEERRPVANSGFLAGAPVAHHRKRDDDDDDDHRYHDRRHGHGTPHQKSGMARFLDFFD